MKELKKQLSFNLTLLLLASFVFVNCNSDTEDFLEDSSNLTNDLATIDVQKDLSAFNFENFILQNNSFKLQINDTLSLDFEDVEHPAIDDPEEDVVYNTKDSRGSITFDLKGNFYFIYNSDKGTYYGSLHNKESEASNYTEEIRKKELERKGNTNNKRLLNVKGKHNVIEFQSNLGSHELSREEKSKLNNYHEISANNCIEVVKNTSIKEERSELSAKSSDKIKLYVYTYRTAFPNRDINFAKIHTRNSLKHAYKNNKEFYRRVSTYFNASNDGNRIANFPENATGDDEADDALQLLYDWEDYVLQNLRDYKYKFK